ncbi:hypothetical protein, partial [Staphylococcus aureus]|uniref:hypothetical protein n=1 Tax=Staphylococcus aureus TaxID=1280 RepID=UPI003F883619
ITIKFICSKQFFVIGVNIKNGVSIKNIRWRNDDSFKKGKIVSMLDNTICFYRGLRNEKGRKQ